jgi:cardiolipin synthase
MQEKRLTIPNVISAIRIVTIPVIIWLIICFTEKYYSTLIIIFFFSILLDFLDGYLARKLGQESELGKILDPLADKLMIVGVTVALVIKTDFPIWLAVILIGRDLIILTASTLLFKRKHRVTASILIGKITFALLGALLMIYIIDLSQVFNLEIMKRYFIVLCLCFITWSVIGYYDVYRREKKCLK